MRVCSCFSSPIDQSDSSEEAPLEGDRTATLGGSLVHGFDEVLEEATPVIDVAEEAVVAPMCPIRSVGGGGSAESVGETPGVSEDVGRKSLIGCTRSRGEVSITVGREVQPLSVSRLGSFSHISLPLPTVSDLLFSGGGVDDLNVDNVNRPLELPSANAPILFGSFFTLASSRHAERSPSSVHRVGSSGEGGMSEIKGPVCHRVSFPDGVATSKGADAMSGRAAEPVAPVEGGAVEAVIPDNDEGSGDNSSVGQHVPTDGGRRVAVGEAPLPPFYFLPLVSYF
ncbi:hypothetical protein ACLOJK_035053 [Asimina triloba]